VRGAISDGRVRPASRSIATAPDPAAAAEELRAQVWDASQTAAR
jgi:hypothetical protein